MDAVSAPAAEDWNATAAGSGRVSRRVLAGLAAALALASLLCLLLFIEIYRSQLNAERGAASEQVNRLLQVSLENAMLKRDLSGLQEIVERLGQQPGITRVRIINPAGEVRFASSAGDLGQTLSFADLGCATCLAADTLTASTQLMTTADGREVLRSINPIANREACKSCHGTAAEHPVNGVLVVDHAAAGLRGDALRAAAVMSGAGLLVVLAGLGTVWVVLQRKVLAPITRLDKASRALAAGDLQTRVRVDAVQEDEIVALCRSFNAMADKIEAGVREVREQEAFLKTLIDTVPDAVRVMDESYTVVMANKAYARQAGAALETLIGVPCWRIHGRSERCPATLETCPFDAITADGAPIKYIHSHVRADGTRFDVETTAARLTIDHGGSKRVLIIEAIRDFEQQVRLSHEQRLSEIGQLAAGVAHEIYNPLASIRLGLQAVLRRARAGGGLDPEASGYLDMVDGEIDKCIGVTKRLLDLSQIPSTSLQLVSFTTVIPEVLSLLRFEAESRDLKIVTDLGNDDLRVMATDAELRMLVLNLSQNAFHAMTPGGALTIAGRQTGKEVRISFSDTGGGIAADVLPHIFEPFYSRRADGVSGTGLGLTICKAIATRYHGRISVTSTPGAGTTFTLEFPTAEEFGTAA